MSWRFFVVRQYGGWAVWREDDGQPARLLQSGFATLEQAVDYIGELEPRGAIGFATGYIGPSGDRWHL
jgi:hypothetical protein